MGTFRDLTGQTFDRLTVIERVPGYHKNTKQASWRCRCTCGTEVVHGAFSLTSGRAKTCGVCKPLQQKPHGNRTDPKDSAWKHYILRYQFAAKERGYEWQLTKEKAIELAQQPCHYCGIAPSKFTVARDQYLANCRREGTSPDLEFAEKKVIEANGLDRVDNMQGYTDANTVPCCVHCNRAKRDHSVEDFLAWVHRLVAHQDKAVDKARKD